MTVHVGTLQLQLMAASSVVNRQVFLFVAEHSECTAIPSTRCSPRCAQDCRCAVHAGPWDGTRGDAVALISICLDAINWDISLPPRCGLVYYS